MKNLNSRRGKHIRWDLLCREFWEAIKTAEPDGSNYQQLNFLLQQLSPRDHEEDFRYMLLYLQSYVKTKAAEGKQEEKEHLLRQLVHCILKVWFCAGVANPLISWEKVTHAVGIEAEWKNLQNTVITEACAAIQQAPREFKASGIFSGACTAGVDKTSNIHYDCTGYILRARLQNGAPNYKKEGWVNIRNINIPPKSISVWLRALPIIPLLILAVILWHIWDRECPDSFFSRRRR
ncbi:hypothetical protein C922_02473 [Plasmodium inui San Antonio 1]|uniref:Uncharacterized protein n=1 Tax=Plasmodium inui San Antonio 1 TaxID=1237626 RepID=W7A7Q7_9APIC|nr:hypothetical protein C922_02473 [Plasmodium inui San Antonio 1]EUD67323.1 hypothetical protein C922_02473 [Plasmodium inui San Antonio 1]